MRTSVRDTPGLHPAEGPPDEDGKGLDTRRDRRAPGDLAHDRLLLAEGPAAAGAEGTAECGATEGGGSNQSALPLGARRGVRRRPARIRGARKSADVRRLRVHV